MHETVIRDLRAVTRDHYAIHTEHLARPPADDAEKQRRQDADREASRLVDAAAARAEAAFAELNGWQLAESFSLDRLGEAQGDNDFLRMLWMHRPLFFKEPRLAGPGQLLWVNTALVTQPYGLQDFIRDDVKRLTRAGYRLRVPPQLFASLWNPGACVFLVITLPGTKVRWLPEQRTYHPELEPRPELEIESDENLTRLRRYRKGKSVHRHTGHGLTATP